jgi:hypothetical protein
VRESLCVVDVDEEDVDVAFKGEVKGKNKVIEIH